MTLQPGHRPALKTPLGASGLPRYGYAVLEHFIEPAELPAFRTDIVHALAMPQRPSCERPNNTLVPMRWNDNVVARVLGSEIRRNRIREVTDSTDLRWISGYLSLKEPRSPSLWWHQDWWCWDHPASSIVDHRRSRFSATSPRPTTAVLRCACYPDHIG